MFKKLAVWFAQLRAERRAALHLIEHAQGIEHGHAHTHLDGIAHSHEHGHGDHDHDHPHEPESPRP